MPVETRGCSGCWRCWWRSTCETGLGGVRWAPLDMVAWQLRGVGSSEVGRVQALTNTQRSRWGLERRRAAAKLVDELRSCSICQACSRSGRRR